jgi:hypothetical protein
MPTFNAKTVSSNQVWASPDGQRVIYEVLLDTGQGNAKAKTYSKAIAQLGFEGEVETYEKPGKQGAETFVKQPQKEGYGGGGSRGSAKAPADPFTMYLSYAKDLAVAVMHEGKIDSQLYAEALEMVLVGGKTLFDGRPGNEPKAETKEDTVQPVPENVTDGDLLQDLNKLFPPEAS